MERSFRVDRESSVTAQPGYKAVSAAEWNGPERAWPELSGPFVAQVEQVLGEDAEPDAVFFVESWTVGVDRATQNFLERRRERERNRNREQAVPAFRAVDSFLPFFFTEEDACLPERDRGRTRDAGVAASPAAVLTEGYVAGWATPYREEAAAVAQEPIPQAGPDIGNTCEEKFGERFGAMTLEGACRLLGVAATSTREQIKAAYRRMASRYHPDRLADRLERSSEQERDVATERMVSINEAYRLLSRCRVGNLPEAGW